MDEAVTEELPGQPRLHEALMAYFDWGTAIAVDVSRSPVGADLGQPGPTPRWGYDGLAR
jgi:hemoglobin